MDRDARGARALHGAALTWLDARDGDGAAAAAAADVVGSADRWRRPLAAGVEGAASLVWVGGARTSTRSRSPGCRRRGFVTANLAVTVPLTRALSARVRVENVADRSYEEVRGYPAPGRRLIVGLETSLH